MFLSFFFTTFEQSDRTRNNISINKFEKMIISPNANQEKKKLVIFYLTIPCS